MANQLFQQLMRNHSSQNNIADIIQTIKSSPNPSQMLMNIASQNKDVANILSEVQANGGDAKALFFKKAQEMGIDPSSIINQIR